MEDFPYSNGYPRTPPPPPSLDPGHHQGSPPNGHQQPQAGYPILPTSSMGEPDFDEQNTSGLSFVHHLPSAGNRLSYPHPHPPQIQYQSQTQGSRYESGALVRFQPSTGPGNGSADADGPVENTPELFHSTAPAASQCTIGDSIQGQEQYSYHAEPAAYPQMQPYRQHPYTSPAYPIPAEAFLMTDDPASHIPPYLAQANPAALGEAPGFNAGPNGPNVYIGGAGTMNDPAPLNPRIGPIRGDRTDRRQAPNPYQRPTAAARKTRPVTYEGDVPRLQQRCRRQGADEGAIGLLGTIFTSGVSLAPLTRLLTDAEAETKEFGIETGQVYTALLGCSREDGGVEPRYICRLCHSAQTWKHHKDVLRHLRRDHFGLADVCDQCSKKFYTKGEENRHPCKSIGRGLSSNSV